MTLDFFLNVYLTRPDGIDHGVGPVDRVEFAAGPRNQPVYRTFADAEDDGNVPRRLARRDPLKHFAFTQGEFAPRPGTVGAVEQGHRPRVGVEAEHVDRAPGARF